MMDEGLGPLVRKADPDRYLCALFAPAARREVLFALYAYNHELARACEVTREPGLALIRLQWWREVVEGSAKRHEVATPLHAAVQAGALEESLLLEMIQARERETEGDFENVDVWLDWLRQGPGALMQAAALALGAPAAEAAGLRGLGVGCAAMGQLRNVGALAVQGRCLLPWDVLARHGLDRDVVIAAPDAPAFAAMRGELSGLAVRALGQKMRRDRGWIAACLPAVLARRDARAGAAPQGARGLGDQLAVAAAFARGAC